MNELIQGWGIITLTLSIPILCYFDIKSRSVPNEVFLLLAGTNIIPLTAWYLIYGLSLWFFVSSLLCCLAFFAIHYAFGTGAFGGADRNFLCCIVLFMVYNPFDPRQIIEQVNFIATLYQVKFITNLLMVTCMVPLYIAIYNIYHRNHFDNAIDVARVYPGGFPFMIPISIAYLITLIWGV